jgi:hypothetical protein
VTAELTGNAEPNAVDGMITEARTLIPGAGDYPAACNHSHGSFDVCARRYHAKVRSWDVSATKLDLGPWDGMAGLA